MRSSTIHRSRSLVKMGRVTIGSSELIEFFIALLVGLLAVLGALFCIGFLLVEPVRNPVGENDDLALTLPECSPPMSESMLLPVGCTINNDTLVERFFCDLSACNLCSLEFRQAVCCCRTLEEEIVQAECDGNMNFGFRNTTRCGCTSCDDIDATVQVTVLSAEDNTPIPAAQIRQRDSMELLGITLNNGQFVFQEPLRTRNITIAVQAPDFLTGNVSINLENGLGRQVITVTVLLNPLLVLQLGSGGAAVTVQLGSAAVSASAGAFRTNETREPYEDLVTFRGVFMDMQTGLAGLPSTRFEYEENGTMLRFGSVLVTFLSFQDVNGGPLTADGLRMAITLPDDDGTLLDNEIFLVVYDEATDTWTRTSDFQVVNIPGVQKRQLTTTVLEDENIPVEVFAAVAMLVSANCWIQARTFEMDGSTLSGTFVRLEQMNTLAGNEFAYRFGTNTGAFQTTIDSLVSNAVCLPLACDGFTIAFVEARRSSMPTTSDSLIPVDFPGDTFNATEDAPVIIGDMFSIESVILRNGPLPFYPDQTTCVVNGREATSQSDLGEFFSFNPATSPGDDPASGLCYIKLLIRDCFSNNTVTLNSINTIDGNVDFSTMVVVPEFEEFVPLDDTSTPEPLPPIPCNSSNASPRGVCIEFNCSNVVQAVVRQNPDSPTTGFCDVTSLAPILSSPLISGSTTNQQLLIDTSVLLMNDYNEPDIGLYHDDTTPQVALERCNAGNMTTAPMIDILAGYAAEFTCFNR